MSKEIYNITLCCYDENNIPEPILDIFVKSDKDLTEIPKHVLTDNLDIQEALIENGCDGISNIFKCSEDEYETYKEEGYEFFEI